MEPASTSPPQSTSTRSTVTATATQKTTSQKIISFESTSIQHDGSTVILTVTSTGRTTSTVPLLTAFKPPSPCSNRYYAWNRTNTEARSGYIWSDGTDWQFAACQPSAPPAVYSPGMCPSNMAAATASVDGAGAYTERCCQTGFALDGHGGGCTSLVTGTTNVLVAPAVTLSDYYTPTAGVIASHTPLDVFWHATDLAAFPAAEADRRRQVMAALATSTSSVAVAEPTQMQTDSAGMSTQAKIGIGVGVGVSVAILALFVSAWVVRVRMRRRRVAPRDGAQELDSHHTAIWKRFMNNSWRAEMPNNQVPAELEGNKGESKLAKESDEEGGQVRVQVIAELEGTKGYSNPAYDNLK